MSLITHPHIHPEPTDLAAAVVAGLSSPRKSLPCKLFYDQRGSELFDAICELPEYYPTRTELAIMRRSVDEMAGAIGSDALLIEYGSGSSLKTRLLLEHSHRLAGYVPIDISREHLLTTARALADAFPAIEILPVVADYTEDFDLPAPSRLPARRVAYFPGSTIGNFHPHEAVTFLQSIRRTCGPGGGLLIGVDLKKDPAILHAAYNDAAGVTADFNRNILARINRELDGGFDLDQFAHYAFYNPTLGRIEMHLVSLTDQTVRAAGETFAFANGESIHTECSYKYTLDGFAALAGRAGYKVQTTWTDPRGLFSVQYLA